METFFKYASRYEELGLGVIPLHTVISGRCSCGDAKCPTPGKHPRIAWGNYQTRRATNEEIKAWGKRWPEANIGIVTGAVSGIIVIDVDGEPGKQTLAEGRYHLPPTWTVATGGGGIHYYYRHPGFPVGNAVRLLPGLDVRGDGGYVVAPPSQHKSGKSYDWMLNPADTDLADAPEWLLTLIRRQSAGGKVQPEEWEATLTEGQRNEELTRRAGSLLKKMPAGEVLTMLQAWNQKHCQPPLSEDEVRTIVESIAKREAAKHQEADEEEKKTQAIITCLADVAPEEVTWLWEPYIPLGKLTILEGDPAVGKTWIALQLAASVSKGDPFPNAEDGKPSTRREPANVIYLSAEDGLADTLRPRLDKAGADVKRIFALQGWRGIDPDTGESVENKVTLQDISILGDAIEKCNPALVVVDPLQAYLGSGVDMHRANEVRPILAGLAKLAEEHKTAVLLIRHLGKSSQDRAIYRGLGSIDFVAAARSVLMAGQDPNEPANRALIHTKSSLAAAGPSIGYELREGGFYWTGLSELTAESVLAPVASESEKSAIDEAKEFLIELLSNGPVLAKEVQKQRKAAGISEITLNRAKAQLVIKSLKYGSGWYWSLSDNSTPGEKFPKNICDDKLDNLDETLAPQGLAGTNQDYHMIDLIDNRQTIAPQGFEGSLSRLSSEGVRREEAIHRIDDKHPGEEVF